MKKIKNKYAKPVDLADGKKRLEPGKERTVELTPRVKELIANNVLDDLGDVNETAKKKNEKMAKKTSKELNDKDYGGEK